MPIFSSTGGTIPSLSSSNPASKCSGRTSGLPCSDASSFARCTASCAFTVNLSQRMGIQLFLFATICDCAFHARLLSTCLPQATSGKQQAAITELFQDLDLLSKAQRRQP